MGRVQAPALIDVCGLCVGTVLRDVDLGLAEGEIVALAGRSGAGKTSLARALVGLVRPTGGTIRFDGRPVAYTRTALRAYRRQVQLVPQDPGGSLAPHRRVGWTVAEGLRIHGMPVGDRPAEILAEVGLPSRALNAYPRELSGGQQQRVAIAAALAIRPRVLIADEPVSSLDPPARAGVLELLLRLRDDHTLTVLLITHDLAVAWQAADRLAVLAQQRIVEAGPVEHVLRSPSHPATAALLAASRPPGR